MVKPFHLLTVYAVLMTLYVVYLEYNKQIRERAIPLIPIIASAVAPVVIGGAAKTTEVVGNATISRVDGSRRL